MHGAHLDPCKLHGDVQLAVAGAQASSYLVAAEESAFVKKLVVVVVVVQAHNC